MTAVCTEPAMATAKDFTDSALVKFSTKKVEFPTKKKRFPYWVYTVFYGVFASFQTAVEKQLSLSHVTQTQT